MRGVTILNNNSDSTGTKILVQYGIFRTLNGCLCLSGMIRMALLLSQDMWALVLLVCLELDWD